VRKVKVRLLRRQGPDLIQPYRDLHKLLRKEVVLADNASWVFRAAPYVIFATTWVAAALVPTFATGLAFSPAADLIAIVALLGELEIHALSNIVYDLERFGLRFVASPRHADVLLVTGPVTTNMREALERTYNATPAPKWVVAVGDCARDGGVFAGSYACVGGISGVLPVDLHIRGCPPSPIVLLKGLLALVETVQTGADGSP
jgi:Ni,Fe-hydrogenase III small subunit